MITPLRHSGMARVLKASHSFTCTLRIHLLPSQPKLVLIYRPRSNKRLSWPWVDGWLHTKISIRQRELNPDTVTHLSTNRTGRRLTIFKPEVRLWPFMRMRNSKSGKNSRSKGVVHFTSKRKLYATTAG